jgi:hypothetical protein
MTSVERVDLGRLNQSLAVYDDLEALDGQHWFALAGIYSIALKVARAILEDYKVDVKKLTRDRDIFEAVVGMHPPRAEDIWDIYRIKPFYDFIMRRLEVPIPFDANRPGNEVITAKTRNATIRLLALAVQVRSHVVV